MSDKAALKKQIDEEIAKVCAKIANQPMLYFSEADIQQLLVERLRSIGSLRKPCNTSVRRGKDADSVYKTSRIHREYGAGGKRRIDIVIFDRDMVSTINKPSMKAGTRYADPTFAIELGTEKSSGSEATTKKHLHGDIEKVAKYQNGVGYVIHVFKDMTETANHKDRRFKTEKKIEALFKNPINDVAAKQPANVCLLAILLSPFRQVVNPKCKCKMYHLEKRKFISGGINNKGGKLVDLIEKQLRRCSVPA